MITAGITYPSRVFYSLSNKDGNGQNAGQLRAAEIVQVDDETQVATLAFYPWKDDGFSADTIIVKVENVPYQAVDEKKGASSPPGTWF